MVHRRFGHDSRDDLALRRNGELDLDPASERWVLLHFVLVAELHLIAVTVRVTDRDAADDVAGFAVDVRLTRDDIRGVCPTASETTTAATVARALGLGRLGLSGEFGIGRAGRAVRGTSVESLLKGRSGDVTPATCREQHGRRDEHSSPG